MVDDGPEDPVRKNQKIERSTTDEDNSFRKITVNVITLRDKKSFTVPENISVKDFKEIVRHKFNFDGNPAEMCFIFAGKVMRDTDTMKQYKIMDGHTIHFFVRGSEQTAASSVSTSFQDPAPNILLSGLEGIDSGFLSALQNNESLEFGSNFVDTQTLLQEIMQNADVQGSFFEDHFPQHMINNPDSMRALFTSSSQLQELQELIERNPEINHMLNNPDLLRQIMASARNPALLQELMRSNDRAISNLESIPGGFNALQRMYRDIQEPMLSAAAEQFIHNPFADLVDNSSPYNPQQGRENSEPLPNPWNSQSQRSASTHATSTSPRRPPFMSRSFLQQAVQNPSVLSNERTATESEPITDISGSTSALDEYPPSDSSLLVGNRALQEQIRGILPQIFQSPQLVNLLSNLQTISHTQQGMETFRQTTPNLPEPILPGEVVSESDTRATAREISTSIQNQTAPITSNTTTTRTSQQQADVFQQFITRIGELVDTCGGITPTNSIPPEERYQAELEQLAAMGFRDRQANLEALMSSNGDITAAVEKLLTLE